MWHYIFLQFIIALEIHDYIRDTLIEDRKKIYATFVSGSLILKPQMRIASFFFFILKKGNV